jgi:hypothetical protein
MKKLRITDQLREGLINKFTLIKLKWLREAGDAARKGEHEKYQAGWRNGYI